MRITINGKLWAMTWNDGTAHSCGCRVLSDVYVWQGNDSYGVVTPKNEDGITTPAILDTVFEQWWEAEADMTGRFTKVPQMMVAPIDYRASGGNKSALSVNFTQQLIQWLIDKKEQFIITGPVYANPNYGKDKASLCQMAMWFPPLVVQAQRLLPDSMGIFNEPDMTEGAKTINPRTKLFSESITPTPSIINSRLAKAKVAWENARGFVNGLPPVKQKPIISWGTK